MKRLALLLLLSACTNISQKAVVSSGGNPAFTGVYQNTSAIQTHAISNVTVASIPQAGGNGVSQTQISLFVASGAANFTPLTQYCGPANLCFCELQWTQVSPSQPSGFVRTRRLPAVQWQSGMIACQIEDTVWNEIAMDTVVRMNIVPGSTNATGLNCKNANYKKGIQNTATGNFMDSNSTPFLDIYRYGCHTKNQGPHEILNRSLTLQPPQTPTPAPGVPPGPSPTPIDFMMGSCFCTQAGNAASAGNANGGGGQGVGPCSTATCPTSIRGLAYSAQNYYRNFYVRSDQKGSITASNNTYECPEVLEPITTSATSDAGTGLTTVPSNVQSKFWPLDSTFALAMTRSSEWSVGVRAASVLLQSGSPNTNAAAVESCPGATSGFTENGVYPRCLGFAKPPKSDGTCGTIQDINGRIRPLTRLRRYRAVLPARFDATGNVLSSGQSGAASAVYINADEVYVPDRLVLDSNGVATGEMIYGPKPCNYAWFDHEGVTNRHVVNSINYNSWLNTSSSIAIPRYTATSKFWIDSQGLNPIWNPGLSGNPDGLVFPNRDTHTAKDTALSNQASCSASLPEPQYQMGVPKAIELFTSNVSHDAGSEFLYIGPLKISKKEIHMRPVDPWVPNYLEDTSFQACVPLSNTYVEPPLHFFKDANSNYGWCAEVYPNQNPNWNELSKKRRLDTPGSSLGNTIVNWNAAASGPNIELFRVKGYTSHPNSGAGTLDSRNTCTGTTQYEICKNTDPVHLTQCENFMNKLGGGTALQPMTCDRTVIFSAFKDYRDFPILAEDQDIEDMLKADLLHDKDFSCTYSVSPDQTKVKKRYPSTACCGKIGGVAVLSGLINASPGASGKGGHLEPQTDPQAPNYRYCGSPIR